MSGEDIVKLTATWEYYRRHKQYSCLEKHNKLKGDKLEAFKNRNGCGFRVTQKPRQTVGTINYHSCFCDHLHSDFDYLYYLYQQYSEKSLLPYPGSLTEQPNQIVEVFRLFDKFKFEAEQQEQETQSRLAQSKARK